MLTKPSARRKRRTYPTFRGSRSLPFRPRRSSRTSPISIRIFPRSQTCSLGSQHALRARLVDRLAQAAGARGGLLLLPDDFDEADRGQYNAFPSSEMAGREKGSLTKAFEAMLPA